MRAKIFIIGIIIALTGVTLQFMALVTGFPEWLSYAGMPIMMAGLCCVIMFGIKWNRHAPYVPLQKIEKDVLIEYFNGRVPEDTVRLFVSDDRMSRVRICSDGDVAYIVFEQLALFDKDELQYALNYGWWAPAMPSGFKSIYDCAETALKENVHLIKDMTEVLLPLPSKNTYKIKFVRPKKFFGCLQTVEFKIDGDCYLIKNGQTVEVDVGAGMHVILLDGNPYLVENLNTDCEFLIKAHYRFAGGSYFTLEK